VLAALSERDAMTAGEVAAATGLGRGTVSTTLSKLAKTAEVRKAERGYQLRAASATAGSDASASASGSADV
jgi:DNA-binding IclR family transcriptional regulator